MNEMVDKLAMAMREAYAKETGETPLVEFAKSRARKEWRVCARAALRAMRDPTDEMSEAGRKTMSRPLTNFISVWQAAIDAALGKGEGE